MSIQKKCCSQKWCHSPMLKNVSSTMLVMVVTMLSSFATTIVFGRILSVNAFGEFALLKQIILMGPTIAIFGLDFSYIKMNPKNSLSNRYVHFLSITVFISISFIFVIVLKLVYDFQYYQLWFILFSVCFGAINLYLASIFRLKNKFFLAQLFAGGWKIVLLIILGIMILLKIKINIESIYGLFLSSILIFSSFMLLQIYNSGKTAKDAIDSKHYLKMGMLFWLVNSTGLISGGIDKLVIPLVYGKDVLGIFTGVSFIFTTSLTMIGSAIGYVIFPKMSGGQEINVRKMSLYLFGVVIAAIVLFQFVGIELVGLVFADKFNNHISPGLIYSFSIIGSLQIVHTILHFMISARATNKHLLSYWVITIIFIAFFILLQFIWKFTTIPVLPYIALVIIITRVLKVGSMLILLKFINCGADGSLVEPAK